MNSEIIPPKYFKLARNESFKSTYRIKVGAVIVSKKPICKGHNSLKTHTRFANPESNIKLSIHAEISCLIQKKFENITGMSIYVYREDNNGLPAMSRPCEHCLKELKIVGIRKIFYSTPIFPYFKMEKIS